MMAGGQLQRAGRTFHHSLERGWRQLGSRYFGIERHDGLRLRFQTACKAMAFSKVHPKTTEPWVGQKPPLWLRMRTAACTHWQSLLRAWTSSQAGPQARQGRRGGQYHKVTLGQGKQPTFSRSDLKGRNQLLYEAPLLDRLEVDLQHGGGAIDQPSVHG